MQREKYIHVNKYGDKFYYSDKAMTVLHRDDGPAIEHADDYKIWYINDKIHREDGPAIEYANGSKSWYLNDEALTEKQFNERMNPVVELTLEDIAAKFGIAVDKLKIKK
jgi:hypothetical protein